MNSYWQLLIFFFAAINPASAALALAGRGRVPGGRPAWQVAALGALLAAAVYAGVAAGADRFLEALDIEPESFRVAAGVVMATAGAFAIWRAAPEPPGTNGEWDSAVFPIAIPLLVTPAGLAAAITYGADDGGTKAFAALIIPLALGAALLGLRTRRANAALDGVSRVTGALLVAVAAGLVVDGVRAI